MTFIGVIKLVFGLVTVIVVGSIAYVVFTSAKARSAREELERTADRIAPEYDGLPRVNDGMKALLTNVETQTALLVFTDGTKRELPFSAFQTVEIVEDGYATSRTVRKGTIGRAVVGGVLAGGVGALVGAATAAQETTSKTTVSDIHVRLTTDDPELPVIVWGVFKSAIGVEMTPSELKLHRANAAQIEDTLRPLTVN